MYLPTYLELKDGEALLEPFLHRILRDIAGDGDVNAIGRDHRVFRHLGELEVLVTGDAGTELAASENEQTEQTGSNA